MYSFEPDTYNDLYAALLEEDPDSAAAFASFFSTDEDGYYWVNNYDAYMDWLNGLFGDEDYSPFTAWRAIENGKSSDGSGNM